MGTILLKRSSRRTFKLTHYPPSIDHYLIASPASTGTGYFASSSPAGGGLLRLLRESRFRSRGSRFPFQCLTPRTRSLGGRLRLFVTSAFLQVPFRFLASSFGGRAFSRRRKIHARTPCFGQSNRNRLLW